MSSQLTSLVPVLTGANYVQWSESITSYLMSLGVWGAVLDVKQAPTAPDALATDADADDIARHAEHRANYKELKDEFKKWNDDNLRAMGVIRLRCSPAISSQIKEKETAKGMWDQLKDEHSKPGLAAIYADC